ncbi:MAG: T9SS type A sorting domain-containing protein, partial [Bacteroidetes bacterium]|nr:T9SS type A sorting domain-containing protein [Bacteroidota bacterium]
STKTGAQLETASVNAGVTTFLRPEDGTWNPNDLSEFYFATTDRYDGVKDGASSQVGRSRLWKLKFSDINNPENGGTIEAVLDGTEAGNMFDNICFDNNGNMILLEDVGGNAHNGKVFQYTPATDVLTMIAKHDASRFGDIGKSATSPFNNDEETSGVIDVSCILGNGWFLIVDQAHSTTGMPSDVVENGQFLAMYNPGSVFSSPSGSNSVCVGSSISLSHNALNGVWSSVAGRAWVNTNGVVTGTSAGNALIKYTATNATGCTLSATKTVVVSALPAIPTIGIVPGTPSIVGGGGYCKNKTFSVIGKPTGGSWSSTGAFSISNSGLITTSSTPGAGSVSYAVTNANGCISSRTINANVVTCASKGINDSRNVNNQFTMYPNPAKSTINISVETLVGAGSIVVVDMYGKQVKTQPLSLGNNTVDIANLAKGFYFVSTITSEGKSTKKLVVE